MKPCAFVEPRLRALVDGELEPGESRKVLEHLERCSRCRDEHARLQAISLMLQEQDLEEVPPHFSANLQVRLARHRKERAEKLERAQRWPNLLRGARFTPPWQWSPRARWGTGVALAGALGAACMFSFSRGIEASEVARKAERSWLQVRNYGCEFISQGVYQGQERTFRQRQFYRKVGDKVEFRLDTSQDYMLTTFVKPDRVIHYLPGGDWKGQGPLVIVRPRREGQNALPLPFGMTWQNGGNISLEQLVHQLNQNDDAAVVGKEEVGGRECYRVRFTAVPPGGSLRDQYEVWVDKESYLPRRVSWYRDEQNHITMEASNLQVNDGLLPEGTFDFQVPEGACVVQGDIDPHVLALPFVPERDASFVTRPILTARYEGWKRVGSVPFPVRSPGWLPDGFELIRVRRKVGRWVDMHWARELPDGTYQVLKLVEQETDADPGFDLRAGERVKIGGGEHPILGRMTAREMPYSHRYVAWRQGGTRFTLFASDLSSEELLRIAGSLREVSPPPPPRSVALRRAPRRVFERGEPSALPSDFTASDVTPAPDASTPETPAAPTVAEQPPMMPEMSDDDRTPALEKPGGG